MRPNRKVASTQSKNKKKSITKGSRRIAKRNKITQPKNFRKAMPKTINKTNTIMANIM